jgi:hypothetical protein
MRNKLNVFLCIYMRVFLQVLANIKVESFKLYVLDNVNVILIALYFYSDKCFISIFFVFPNFMFESASCSNKIQKCDINLCFCAEMGRKQNFSVGVIHHIGKNQIRRQESAM